MATASASESRQAPNGNCPCCPEVFAPSGTPRPIVEKLHDEIAKALTDPAVRKLLTEQGAESPPLSLAELRDYVHSEKELYGAIVRAGDMKAD